MQTSEYKASYSSLCNTLENFYRTDEPKIIAIDGRCGSGKTTLAKQLATKFDSTLFHLDDFFLPFEMKTNERMSEPGGNVHYERFKEEVLLPLQSGSTTVHRPYNCQQKALDDPIQTAFKHLTIVEGVYSLHPALQDFYDYKVFLTVDKNVQRKRIQQRNGKEKLETFIQRWIPLEEHYFDSLQLEKQCDLVINTTTNQ
ncbi:NB-ARC domain-containing protein [Oceanobacillus sp. FSL K6-2867]|uniref:uridine kinase family protein n=1 Tax=Oceanobacillus sp. FSL K6-2867 TaxID=2954748 RepID=UPI0030DB83A3